VAAKDAQLLPEQKSYGQVNSGGGTNLKEGGGTNSGALFCFTRNVCFDISTSFLK